jgi:hypothetical protein
VNLNPIYFSAAQSNDSTECYCCYGKLNSSPLSTLPCGHSYHTECVNSVIGGDHCPHCRNNAIILQFPY